MPLTIDTEWKTLMARSLQKNTIYLRKDIDIEIIILFYEYEYNANATNIAFLLEILVLIATISYDKISVNEIKNTSQHILKMREQQKYMCKKLNCFGIKYCI